MSPKINSRNLKIYNMKSRRTHNLTSIRPARSTRVLQRMAVVIFNSYKIHCHNNYKMRRCLITAKSRQTIRSARSSLPRIPQTLSTRKVQSRKTTRWPITMKKLQTKICEAFRTARPSLVLHRIPRTLVTHNFKSCRTTRCSIQMRRLPVKSQQTFQ